MCTGESWINGGFFALSKSKIFKFLKNDSAILERSHGKIMKIKQLNCV